MRHAAFTDLHVSLHEHAVFLIGPPVLLDVGVKLIVPALAALLASAACVCTYMYACMYKCIHDFIPKYSKLFSGHRHLGCT